TTTDYFNSSRKGRQPQAKGQKASEVQAPKPEVSANGKAPRTTPQAKRSQKIEIRVDSTPIRRARANRDTAPIIDDEDDLGGDDIFATGYRKPGRGRTDDDYVEDEDRDFNDFIAELPAMPSTTTSAKKVDRNRK